MERLASLPVADRREVPGLEPERAPVIVGGAIVVRETLRHFGLDALEVSERDLLTGAALAAAELPEPVEGARAARCLHVLLRLAALCCAALVLGGCGGGGGEATSYADTTAASGLPAGCDPAAVKASIDRFLAAITAGDRRRIARSLSPEPDFERLTIADPDGVFRTASRAKAADYLAARHRHGENERLLQAVVAAGSDAGHALGPVHDRPDCRRLPRPRHPQPRGDRRGVDQLPDAPHLALAARDRPGLTPGPQTASALRSFCGSTV